MLVKTLKIKDEKELDIQRFPNFNARGSIKGMKEKYYGKDALLIRCGSYIYYVGNLNGNNSEVLTYGETLYFHYAY